MVFHTSTVTEISSYPAIVHCSSVLEVNGVGLCVWYEGPYETSANTVLRVSRRQKGAQSWDAPTTLFDFHGLALGNPVLWCLPPNQLFLTFPVLLAESWTESLLFYSISRDGGLRWQPPSLFLPHKGFMPKTRPLIQKDGPILFPLYHEKEFCPYVMLLEDPCHPLGSPLVGETMARGKAIQPALVQRDEGSILLLARTNQGKIWKSISYNRGYSWSICTPTSIPNPNSAIDLVRFQDRICLVYNDASLHRRSLRVALSRDGGKTWYASRRIVEGEGEYSYPSLWVGEESMFLLTYTVNRYRIQCVSFDVDWVESGSDLPPFPTE